MLYLIRHTSVDVPAGVCYGQSDVAPAPSYEEEKEEIKKVIAGIKFIKIFSSPLNRCKKLAADIAPVGTGIEYDKRLMELDFGQWEMQPWNDISKTERAQIWFADFVNVKCPGGESYGDLLNRVENFIKELKEQYSGKEDVLVIAHGGVIRAFHALLNDIAPEKAFELKVHHGEIFSLSF